MERSFTGGGSKRRTSCEPWSQLYHPIRPFNSERWSGQPQLRCHPDGLPLLPVCHLRCLVFQQLQHTLTCLLVLSPENRWRNIFIEPPCAICGKGITPPALIGCSFAK